MGFTDAKVRNLPPGLKEYTRSGLDADKGLVVRVHPSGKKTFYHFYAHPETGETVRLRLNQYPALSLKEARKRVETNRELIVAGKDPQSTQRAERVLAQSAGNKLGTVADLFEAYYQAPNKKSGKPKKTVKAIRRAIEKDLTKNPRFPEFPKMLARDVEDTHITNILSPVVERAPVHANRLRSYIMAAFSIGKKYDNMLQFSGSGIKFRLKGIANPVETVERNESVERSRIRYLTYDEIKDVINSEHIPDKHKLQIKLLLAYGSRVGEIIYMPISELNFKKKTWTLPVARSKNARENVLPMTELTEQLFKEACEVCRFDNGYLFPKIIGFKGYDCSGCTSKNTLAKYIRIHCDEMGMEKFLPKDLRRTFKTLASEEGLSSDILNKIQNHALHGVDMTHYNLAKHVKQKHEALEEWHGFLIKEAGF